MYHLSCNCADILPGAATQPSPTKEEGKEGTTHTDAQTHGQTTPQAESTTSTRFRAFDGLTELTVPLPQNTKRTQFLATHPLQTPDGQFVFVQGVEHEFAKGKRISLHTFDRVLYQNKRYRVGAVSVSVKTSRDEVAVIMVDDNGIAIAPRIYDLAGATEQDTENTQTETQTQQMHERVFVATNSWIGVHRLKTTSHKRRHGTVQTETETQTETDTQNDKQSTNVKDRRAHNRVKALEDELCACEAELAETSKRETEQAKELKTLRKENKKLQKQLTDRDKTIEKQKHVISEMKHEHKDKKHKTSETNRETDTTMSVVSQPLPQSILQIPPPVSYGFPTPPHMAAHAHAAMSHFQSQINPFVSSAPMQMCPCMRYHAGAHCC